MDWQAHPDGGGLMTTPHPYQQKIIAHYEPPKWITKQTKPFIDLINKIPVEDTHAIIIEAANQAATLAFDQTYEVLVRLASGLPAQETLIIPTDTETEVLLELKNIFQDSLFTSQQVVDYLKTSPQQFVWFEKKLGRPCGSATVLGGWFGRVEKNQDKIKVKNNKTIKSIKIERSGYTPTKATLWHIWSVSNA
jgi:hypothetical protein